jgi:hypothetical protein
LVYQKSAGRPCHEDEEGRLLAGCGQFCRRSNGIEVERPRPARYEQQIRRLARRARHDIRMRRRIDDREFGSKSGRLLKLLRQQGVCGTIDHVGIGIPSPRVPGTCSRLRIRIDEASGWPGWQAERE